MNRRQMMSTLGLTAAAACAAGAASAANQHEGHGNHFEPCAQACADCQVECHGCHRHCSELVAAGQKEHLETMRLCADCGDVCATAANIVARGGPLSETICQSCVEACEACAKACEKYPDDRHMKSCAEECRKCAKACREMLKQSSSGRSDRK